MTDATDPNERATPGPAKRSRRRRRRPAGDRPAPNSGSEAAGATHTDDAEPTVTTGSVANTTKAAPAAPSGPKRRRRSRRRRSGSSDGSSGQDDAPKLRSVADPAPAVNPAAKALSDTLQAAILTHTSGAVLARGRGYVKRNRVGELHIGAGRVRARVLGSAGERYRVEIAAPQRPAPPVVTKIRWSCDCPYAVEHRRGTCKHVVAVTLVAAKRIERTPSMLRRWLGQPAPDAVEADPAELAALADRLRDAFTAEPVSAGDVLARAIAIAPPPFSVPAR